MEYNTQQRKLPLPEYGRSIQNMVDYALTITDRAERQRCANTIVGIMGNMFPHLRDIDDFKHKLWDHLAIMADFKLDIDYPVEVVKKESLEVKPDRIPYKQTRIRYRHYGRFIQDLIDQAASMEDGERKKELLTLIANHMKADYVTWNNKDGIEDQKIFDDICVLSGGKINLAPGDIHIAEEPVAQPASGQQRNTPSRKQGGKNQQKKKY